MSDAALPRDEDGEIVTSANFGEAWLVEILWSTDADGSPIDDEERGLLSQPRTWHGPFVTEQEARDWLEAYPDDTDVDDMMIGQINLVRPKGAQ